MVESIFKKLPLDNEGKLIVNGSFIFSPRTMVIISFPKMGKTDNFVNVPGFLIGDCQGGTAYFKANNFTDLTTYLGEDPYTELKTGGFCPTGLYETVLELRKANRMKEYWDLYTRFLDAKGPEKDVLHTEIIAFLRSIPFPVFIIDPITELQEMLKEAALRDYNKQMNKQKTSIKRVDEYGGSQYIRRTVFDNKRFIENNAAPFIIYTGHIKERKKILNKSADDIDAADMDLEGTLSTIFTSQADAVGIFYRDEKGCYLDFRKKEETAMDSRPQHLAGRLLKIADIHKRDEKTNLITERGKTYWDIVYPELEF